MLIKILILFLPWKIRKYALRFLYGYEIHPTSRIGLAWIYPKMLILGENASIDHFTCAVHLDLVKIGDHSQIGRSNWITGFPTNTSSPHFSHDNRRRSELIIGNHSAVTKKHHIDCTGHVHIGNFVTIAGYDSQILTHSIDVFQSRQDSAPIKIGDYSFVGTNVVILGGSCLPPRSVLGAKSLLNKSFSQEYRLYGGVPATEIKELSETAAYFHRLDGFVY